MYLTGQSLSQLRLTGCCWQYLLLSPLFTLQTNMSQTG